MRVIVKGTNRNWDTLTHRMNQKGYPKKYENKKEGFFTFDLPPTDPGFLFELLELGGQVERDVRHDLD